MDRGAWWATVYAGHKESDATEQLSRDTAAGKTFFHSRAASFSQNMLLISRIYKALKEINTILENTL